MGLVRGKLDKLDAERIALFAQKNQTTLKPWSRPEKSLPQLEHLKSLRRRLKSIRAALSQPIVEGIGFAFLVPRFYTPAGAGSN
jgi:transposase